MSEHSIAQARASVMLYNNEKKVWEPSGGSQGVSRVQVYHHPMNNTYRIVGRKQQDHSVVINCALARGLKYNEATPTFHQWRDQRQVYGLNFSSKDDAEVFGEAVHNALEQLKAPVQPPQQQQHEYQQIQNPSEHYRQQQQSDTSYSNGRGNENEDMLTQIRLRQQQEMDLQDQYQRSKVGGGGQRGNYDVPSDVPNQMASSTVHVTPSQPAAPAAPPVPPAAPAAPPAPPVPAAPPGPPSAPPGPPAPPGGGPPAPPPPPPVAAGGAGGNLADQIAAAKLKKAAKNDQEPRNDRSNSVSRGPMGGMDMMAEMQRKLKARRAKEEGEQTPKEEARERPGMPRSPVSNPPPTANKTNIPTPNKTPSNNAFGRTERLNSKSESGVVTMEQLEDFKAEILSEFRNRLDEAKREILEAIRKI